MKKKITINDTTKQNSSNPSKSECVVDSFSSERPIIYEINIVFVTNAIKDIIKPIDCNFFFVGLLFPQIININPSIK